MSSDPRPTARVRVPGSTSNLGPGFDCLGLALGLWVEARVLARRESVGHAYAERSGEARAWSGGADDLFLRAFDRASGRAPDEPGWTFAVASQVPLERGIGSSGAAVAAGLLLGAALARRPTEPRGLLHAGVELEGHPDNVAASLFGGLTLCVPLVESPGTLHLLTPRLAPSLGVVLAWSSHRSPTERARAVLPEHVPFADAVENPRRLALLLEGLASGDASLLEAGSRDRLHEAARLTLIPGGKDTLAAARAAGAPLATVSGSGSALVALAPEDRLDAVRAAMEAALRHHADDATARVVEVVHDAPRVER